TPAQIDGYTIAGKTGTAHKLENGHYSQTDFFASFVGFLPSRDPAVAIIVVLDSPHSSAGHFGGPIAGPIFEKIAEAALRHFGIPPSINAPPPVLVERNGHDPHPPVQAARVPALLPASDVRGARDLPDLTGLSAREALRVLTKLGLAARLNGSGLVTSQRPAAGSLVNPGDVCELRLERESVSVESIAFESGAR